MVPAASKSANLSPRDCVMNKSIVYPKTRTLRRLTKRVPTADGRGFTTVNDGVEDLYYETVIDLDALGELARKAALNKTGNAKDGPLYVRILSRRTDAKIA